MAILVLLAWLFAGRLDATTTDWIGLSSSPVPTGRLLGWMAAAGFIGILVVIGVAFAVGQVGVTAGLAAVILAQLVVGLLLDRAGAATGASLTLDARRIAGLVAMAAGVWLLLPRSG
jgi:uncharacterized membrane protein YdcZ (DUF606 family)